MSQLNAPTSNTISAHEQILHFPKGQQPSLGQNEWLIWSGSQDEGGLPDLEHGKTKVLVPFTWWITHHNEADVQAKAHTGQIGVWFAADDDILKHADLIEDGKKVWPLIAAHFPIFRDGRGYSTAALLRERFGWKGELRAIGDVLIDQLLPMSRVGFDSFSLRNDQSVETALSQFGSVAYQFQDDWRADRSQKGAA